MPTKFHSRTVVCLFALMCFFAGYSTSPLAAFPMPRSEVVFSNQSISLTAPESLGRADVIWSVAGPDANAPLPAITGSGKFMAPEVTENTTYTVTAASRRDPRKSASFQITVMPSGQVTATNNPQVALYTLNLPPGMSAYIEFGTDTSYGLKTWSQSASGKTGPVSIFVAGMLASTLYHMRAVVSVKDGDHRLFDDDHGSDHRLFDNDHDGDHHLFDNVHDGDHHLFDNDHDGDHHLFDNDHDGDHRLFDDDHTFTTQAIPNTEIPAVTVATTPGATPQPGIEMLDLLPGAPLGPPLAAFDLSGNLLWSYPQSGSNADYLQGVHLLPNGHFLVDISQNSFVPLSSIPLPPGTITVLREIDLAGNTIREESLDALNASLLSGGFNITAATFHHDVIALPNGHWIALVNTLQPCTGRPECATNPYILGDVLVDLAPRPDGTFLPVWVWNSFDHLDVTRTPMGVADWTHSNSIVYSPDDGNLLLSIRAQSWIVKIDYKNGKGDGDIIWRLGNQGDFALLGGTDPTDWFYAQHDPSFASPNTTGKFSLTIMDNGDTRVFATGVTCGAPGSPVCAYSSALLLQIDETYKTATIVSHYLPGEYSFWGGNAKQLANGNIEADFTSGSPAGLSDIFEVVPGTAPQVVWQLHTSVQNAYRGFRMPSLYPGVQW